MYFNWYKNELDQIRDIVEKVAQSSYQAGYNAAISKRIHPVGSEELAELRILFKQHNAGTQDSYTAAYFNGMTSGTLIDRLTYMLNHVNTSTPGCMLPTMMQQATSLLLEQTIEALKSLKPPDINDDKLQQLIPIEDEICLIKPTGELNE